LSKEILPGQCYIAFVQSTPLFLTKTNERCSGWESRMRSRRAPGRQQTIHG
jgi:hypothetical protein